MGSWNIYLDNSYKSALWSSDEYYLLKHILNMFLAIRRFNICDLWSRLWWVYNLWWVYTINGIFHFLSFSPIHLLFCKKEVSQGFEIFHGLPSNKNKLDLADTTTFKGAHMGSEESHWHEQKYITILFFISGPLFLYTFFSPSPHL